jgi:predicted amidohydrolase
MIVAGFQMDIAWERPKENFRRVEEMVERTAPSRPDLIVLPEMFATGFSMESEMVAEFAGETREFLADLATRLSVFVLGGYAEPAEPRPANACSIFTPAGAEILHYRKIHPFSLAGEEEHYIGGETVETTEVEGIRVTPLICYDLRFPEPFRAAAPDTDLFCVIANWPSKRREAWSTLLRARAIENQAYVLGVNRVGMGGGEPHTGDSALLDPFGQAIAENTPPAGTGSGDSRPGVLIGTVDPEEVARVRERFSFLKDRRPGLYRRLEEERG